MHFAINTPNYGIYGDPRLLAELAQEAERAGWQGFFIWDHIGAGPEWPEPMADPWIALAAIATSTKSIKIGPMVTPLPRRRPWKVAREAVTLDHLSNGRLILGVGTGDDKIREYSCFGEASDNKLHGEMLDEGLEILTRLWSGETFSHNGKHYQLANARFLPRPVQQPRIPIWVGGKVPNRKPLSRAVRWDGACPIGQTTDVISLDDLNRVSRYVREHRNSIDPFDVAVYGRTTGTNRELDRNIVTAFARAGATWWEEIFDFKLSLEQVYKRIRQGPPQ